LHAWRTLAATSPSSSPGGRRRGTVDTPDYLTGSPKMAIFLAMMVCILRDTKDKVVVFSDELAPLRCYD
jgi:hypothetical protein